MAARPTPASTQQMISRMDRCSTIWSRFCRIVSYVAIFFLHLDAFIAGVPLTRKSFAGRPDCDHKSDGCRCRKERELYWQVSRSLLSLVSCLLSLVSLVGRKVSLSFRKIISQEDESLPVCCKQPRLSPPTLWHLPCCSVFPSYFSLTGMMHSRQW